MVLDGEGAECTLNGLYVGDGVRLVDNHTTIDHAQPHCASREVYKGILADRARAVFNGKIIVRPDAQKTDAKQTNKALLLSEDAQINTKPQLEIFANDVKCTHGAAVGQIDDDAIFYLRARGLGAAEARQMLIRAFAGDVLNRDSARSRSAPASIARSPSRRMPERIADEPSPPPRRGGVRRRTPSAEDFPILGERAHGKPLVYLDNAATTQKPQAVHRPAGALLPARERERPSRRAPAQRAGDRRLRSGAPDRASRFLNAADHSRDRLRPRHDRGDQPRRADATAARTSAPATRCSITAMEHHSNIVPWQMLVRGDGRARFASCR